MVQWAGIIFVVVLLIITIVIGIVLYRESQAPSCKTDADCSTGNICVNGTCMPKPCSGNSDCESSQVCANGICQTRQCTTNLDCQTSQICSGGICIQQTACASDSDCPVGQICNTTTNMCEVNNNLYIHDIVAVAAPTLAQAPVCPEGYTQAQGYGTHNGMMGNGNLKQGTGEDTPNIFLCMLKTGGTSDAITDLVTFIGQTPNSTQIACSELSNITNGVGYSRVTYNLNGQVDSDISKGCDRQNTTLLCKTTTTSNIRSGSAMQDIMVTISDSCPTGYTLGYHTGNGNGDLNQNCGGETVRLCVK